MDALLGDKTTYSHEGVEVTQRDPWAQHRHGVKGSSWGTRDLLSDLPTFSSMHPSSLHSELPTSCSYYLHLLPHLDPGTTQIHSISPATSKTDSAYLYHWASDGRELARPYACSESLQDPRAQQHTVTSSDPITFGHAEPNI